MKKYFSLLDLVRFFAAFWVMNFHYLFVYGFSNNLQWYRYGNLGVQLFFIISGFVIMQSVQGKPFFSFAIGRFIRLFPLFWILCTFTYLITLIVPYTGHLRFNEYLVSMTMMLDVLNILLHTHFRLIDPSYWTLAVELTFYIFIGIFTAIFSYKKIRYFLLAWLAISILAFTFRLDQNMYVKLALVQHATYFIFGCSLFLLAIAQAKNLYEKFLDWGLLLLSAGYSIYISHRAIPLYASINPLDSYIIKGLLLVFFLIIPLFVYLSKYVKNSRLVSLLVILGGMSYPLYLLHQTTGNALINYITNIYGFTWNNFVPFFEVFVILMAYIVYLQDKKIRAWLKNKM